MRRLIAWQGVNSRWVAIWTHAAEHHARAAEFQEAAVSHYLVQDPRSPTPVAH